MGFGWARRGFGFVDSLLHFKGLRGKESPFAPHVELAANTDAADKNGMIHVKTVFKVLEAPVLNPIEPVKQRKI